MLRNTQFERILSILKANLLVEIIISLKELIHLSLVTFSYKITKIRGFYFVSIIGSICKSEMKSITILSDRYALERLTAARKAEIHGKDYRKASKLR